MVAIPNMNWMGNEPTGSAFDVYRWYMGGGNPVANTGGGGGGGKYHSNSGAGGSGVVILRVASALYTGTTTGSPTVTTDGTSTIMTFTGSGTYTA